LINLNLIAEGNMMKKLMKYFKKMDGQSLAEFAVTTAMMATLATTAAPKFSGVGEGAKEKKTMADIDKILKSANNFYNTEVTSAGRGRFPGQYKYNDPVPTGGGYAYTVAQGQSYAELQAKLDLQGFDSNGDGDYDDTNLGEYTAPFTTFDNTTEAPMWASCFGTTNDDAPVPEVSAGTNASISTVEDPSSAYYSVGTMTPGLGAEEFLDGFGGEAIKSPFQDGHYIYTVIAGSGSGTQSIAPIIFVSDLESPSSFWKKLQP
jgi:hypothetical protein|tara:strand:- start:54 stop:839 length:786 start_codon:yes stop_codon:yes gene_type:complete